MVAARAQGGWRRLSAARIRGVMVGVVAVAAVLGSGAVSVAVAQTGLSAPSSGIATPRPIIGVLDQQRVIAESTAARAVNVQKDKFQDVYQASTAEEEKRLRGLDEQLTAQRATLTPEAFSARMTDFQNQVNDFQKQVQNKRRNLERAYAQAMTEVQNAAVRVTDEVAAERGMNIVIYRSQVFLFDPKMDVTDDVIARLNRVLPSVTMVDPEKIGAEKSPAKKGGR